MKKIYFNGNFITLENIVPEAIVIENDIIKKVGSKNEAMEMMDKNTEVIDLKGNTIMPSFIDAHSHIFAYAKKLMEVSLENLTSIGEIKKKLIDYKKKNSLNEWVIANGYDNNILKDRKHITKNELDEIFPNIPVIIENRSKHNGVVNSFALEKLGITEKTINPDGGKINFETGYLEENAFINALKKIPLPKIEKIKDYFKKAQEIYASYGITTAQEGVITKDLAEIYDLLAKEKDIFLDIVAYMDYKNVNEIINKNNEYIKNYKNNLKIAGVKIFLDGSLQAKTAWLRDEYNSDSKYKGYRILKDKDLVEILKKANDNKLQVLAHCNGDMAIKQFIDSIKEFNELERPVIIHSQLLGLDQIEDVKKLNLIPSFFISHIYYFGDIHLKNLGINRVEHLNPAGSCLKHKILFTFHQDTPVLEPNMFESIWCAVNRKTRTGITLGENEEISVLDAIKAVTINAAYQYEEENSKGSIKEGKKANLIILDKNPLTIDKQELRNIKILETIKDGKTIYKI